jgi:hypothetical protein
MLFCTIRPDRAKPLLHPLASPYAEVPDISDEDFDEEELKIFIDECTDFVAGEEEQVSLPTVELIPVIISL